MVPTHPRPTLRHPELTQLLSLSPRLRQMALMTQHLQVSLIVQAPHTPPRRVRQPRPVTPSHRDNMIHLRRQGVLTHLTQGPRRQQPTPNPPHPRLIHMKRVLTGVVIPPHLPVVPAPAPEPRLRHSSTTRLRAACPWHTWHDRSVPPGGSAVKRRPGGSQGGHPPPARTGQTRRGPEEAGRAGERGGLGGGPGASLPHSRKEGGTGALTRVCPDSPGRRP